VSPLSAGGGTSEMTQAIAESVTTSSHEPDSDGGGRVTRKRTSELDGADFGAIVKYKIYRSDAGGALA